MKRLLNWLTGEIHLPSYFSLNQTSKTTSNVNPILFNVGLVLMFLIALAVPFLIVYNGYGVNTDAYYHVGISRNYAFGDFLYDGFRWLPYTALAEKPFPQVYTLQHLLLAPVHWLFDPINALLVSSALTGTFFIASLFLIFRRWNISAYAWWAGFGWLMGPLLIVYLVTFKGAALFLIVLLWFIDAQVRERPLQALITSWLAAYCYLGSVIILPIIAGSFLLAALLHERKLVLWYVITTVAGLVLGFLINPYFPNNIKQLVGEFLTFPARVSNINWTFNNMPIELPPGRWYGLEWQQMTGELILISGGGLLACVPIAIIASIIFKSRISIAATILLCFFSIMTLVSGSKLLLLLMVLALVFTPLLINPLALNKRWIMLLSVIWIVGWGYGAGKKMITYDTDGITVIKQYETLASIIKDNSPKDSLVLAPWDIFPKLYYFNQHNRYFAGMNIAFLDLNALPFKMYYHIMEGKLSDVDNGIKMAFPETSMVLLETKYKSAIKRIEAQPDKFQNIELPADLAEWRLFKVAFPTQSN